MSRNFQNFIRSCTEAVKDSNIPEIFSVWTAASAVAGALGRRVWYDFGPFQVRPNMYVVLIAGPGRGKSLSLILPFDKLFNSITAEPGKEEGAGWEAGVNQMRLEEFGISKRPLYLVRDRVTAEKLSQIISRCGRADIDLSAFEENFQESSMTLVTSEFGTLVNRNDHYLQMFLTGLWDSPSTYTYRTKTRGEDVLKGPCLNWIAGATPEQFVVNLPENARTQGLLSRVIPVFYEGEKSTQDIWYGKAKYGMLEALREDLAQISKLKGEIRFRDEVIDIVRKDVGDNIPPTPINPNLSEYLERRTSHFIKLAINMCAARTDDLIITQEDWENTKELMFKTEVDMPKALSQFGIGKAGRIAFDMHDFLEHLVTSTKSFGIPMPLFRRELLRKVSTPGEVEQTIVAMTDAGLIEVQGRLVVPNVKKAKEDQKNKDKQIEMGRINKSGDAQTKTKSGISDKTRAALRATGS